MDKIVESKKDYSQAFESVILKSKKLKEDAIMKAKTQFNINKLMIDFTLIPDPLKTEIYKKIDPILIL